MSIAQSVLRCTVRCAPSLPASPPLRLAAARFSSVGEVAVPLRYGLSPEAAPAMSEAVRRVLSLDNASRKEVTKARVAKAIEAFQGRPGDTGSTAVQGARPGLKSAGEASILTSPSTFNQGPFGGASCRSMCFL